MSGVLLAFVPFLLLSSDRAPGSVWSWISNSAVCTLGEASSSGISAFTAGAAACNSGISLELSVPFCAEEESDQLPNAILNPVQDKSFWAYRPVLGSLISCFPKSLPKYDS